MVLSLQGIALFSGQFCFLICGILSSLDSLLLLIRCQIHIELAKCEEDNEQLEPAMNHLQKVCGIRIFKTQSFAKAHFGSSHRPSCCLTLSIERSQEVISLTISCKILEMFRRYVAVLTESLTSGISFLLNLNSIFSFVKDLLCS